MKKILLLFFSFHTLVTYAQKTSSIQNEDFSLKMDLNEIRISYRGEPALERVLKPVVQVIKSLNDPKMGESSSTNKLTPQVAWNNPDDLEKVPPSKSKRETDFYKAGELTELNAVSFEKLESGDIRYSFNKNPFYTVTLDISLPKGSGPPLFKTNISVQQEGWYSVGFTGISPQDASVLDFLYQPMIWTWKRFPDKSYLSSEKFATTAATFINNGKFTEGIIPDPSEIPYRFATKENSRFGLLLRNKEGEAQPMIFAPILGGANSFMEPEQTFSFKTRYILKPGDWYAGLNYVLKDVFSYENERKNAALTLNQTLDNIIKIAMNNVSGGWIDSLKGFSYAQDAVGTVKVVSALHQLGAALVTGDKDIYTKRALPTMAYVMSREKYLYTTDERQKIQSPSRLLKGPCVEIGELSGLYQMTQGQTFAFRSEMDRLFGQTRKLNLNTETGGGSWQDYLYRYRVSKNPSDLEKAKNGADEYIKHWSPYPSVFTNNPGLEDKAAAFLTDFAPKLYDLMELYEDTGEGRYLDMALTGARQMILWTRSNPMAPDSIITVNKSGKVKGIIGKRYKINSKERIPGFDYTTFIPEQQVEAWKTSLVGLPPEQPYTYGNGGPIMLTHHPAWFLKLAHMSKDTLLKTAAYNAIFGRYAGFPGYYHTSLHTTVYQSADYAAHDFWDIKYNAIFHNHIFPHITLLIDFLVNDAFYRSEGQVDFPGVYAPGYAFLSSKVYGSKLGSVFGNKDIRLWLPNAAIQSNTSAFNHVLGIANNDFYVILMNTFNERVYTNIRLNPDVIHWVPDKEYKTIIYFSDGSIKQTVFKNGIIEVDIAAQALTAYKIEGLNVQIPLFDMLEVENKKSNSSSFVREENITGFGTLTGMLFNTFRDFSDAYVFIDKTDEDLKEVTMEYRIGSADWEVIEDVTYPYEFDVHLKNPEDRLEFRLRSTCLNNKEFVSKVYVLKNDYD